MRKFKNNIKVIGGLIVGIMIGSATVVFANQAINAVLNEQIRVSLNGVVQNLVDETTGEKQYPITYNNRTYLPLRNVAKLAGLKVDYNEKENIALLNESNDIKISTISIIDCPKSEETIETYEKYSLIPKRSLKFEHNGKSYDITLGIVNGKNAYYIKDNNSKKIELKWESNDDFNLDRYSVNILDFNKSDEDIQLVISWDFNNVGPGSTIYNINQNDFYELGIMPDYNFITPDGRMGVNVKWIEEELISHYYEIKDGKMMYLINIPDFNETYTVKGHGIGIISDSKGNPTEERLKPGEKIRILSVTDNNWVDYKVKRENGDIVIVGEEAGRT